MNNKQCVNLVCCFDDAFDREIAGDGLNAIVWMAAARDLVVGTIKEEFVISSSNGKALSNTKDE
jgi:hypothetical protein